MEIESALARVLTNCDDVLVFRPAADDERLVAPTVSEVRLFPTDARITAPTRTTEPGSVGEISVDRTLAAGLADEDFRGRLAALTSGV